MRISNSRINKTILFTYSLLGVSAYLQHYLTINTSLAVMGGTWSFKISDLSDLILTPDNSVSSCDNFDYNVAGCSTKGCFSFPSVIDNKYVNYAKFNRAKQDVYASLIAERNLAIDQFGSIVCCMLLSLYLSFSKDNVGAALLCSWAILFQLAWSIVFICYVDYSIAHSLCEMLLFGGDEGGYNTYDPLSEFLTEITTNAKFFANYMHRLPGSDGSTSLGILFCAVSNIFFVLISCCPFNNGSTRFINGERLSFRNIDRSFPVAVLIKVLLKLITKLYAEVSSLGVSSCKYLYNHCCYRNRDLFTDSLVGEELICDKLVVNDNDYGTLENA